MSDSETVSDQDSCETLLSEKRQEACPLLTLVVLDPTTVVDGVRFHDCYMAGDVIFAGELREICPVCADTHLQLVLRQEFVKRPHMFCRQCTRCFDGCYPDGTSALSVF